MRIAWDGSEREGESIQVYCMGPMQLHSCTATLTHRMHGMQPAAMQPSPAPAVEEGGRGVGGHLRVHLGGECAADVGSAVVQHDVEEAAGGLLAQAVAALLRGDVLGQRERAAHGLDRHEVDADDARRHRHVLRAHLQTPRGE